MKKVQQLLVFIPKLQIMSGKETLKIIDRFVLKHKLGQGTFSYIYEAYDKHLQKDVALKVEKKDKNKTILLFEYNVLLNLKGLKHVAGVYDFVQNSEQNLIVMDLLGINLARARRCLEHTYSLKIAIHILLEMLVAIQEVHDRGFIHRDVKASNFVLCKENRRVFIVDFGLAKKHLNNDMQVMPKRKKADFRGTVSFASLNAHNNVDLARRDDLWSFYFTMLDFLNEKLEWREQRDYSINQVKEIKTKCLKKPRQKLWIGPTKDVGEVEQIFQQIDKLQYQDRPNYTEIENLLLSIYNNYEMNATNKQALVTTWQLTPRLLPICNDLQRLNQKMKRSRQQDFMDYFNNHKLLQPTRPIQPIIQPPNPQSEAGKAPTTQQLYQNPNTNIAFESNPGMSKVENLAANIGGGNQGMHLGGVGGNLVANVVNDYARLQAGHLPLPHLLGGKDKCNDPMQALGNPKLQPIANMLQNQNYLQPGQLNQQQQRSQLVSQLPISYHQRDQIATPPDDGLGINQNMQHQGNFYYPQQVKQQPNMGHNVVLANLAADPFNLLMQNECHGNQVGGMLNNGSDLNNQQFMISQHQQQQAQLLQGDGIMGVHYFPLMEHGLQNYANNYFAIHQPQPNANLQNGQHFAQDFMQNQTTGFGLPGTPRVTKPDAQRQFDLFNSMKQQMKQPSQAQRPLQSQNQQPYIQMNQPTKMPLQDFQIQQQKDDLNQQNNGYPQPKNQQLHYIVDAAQYRCPPDQQRQYLNNFDNKEKIEQDLAAQNQNNQLNRPKAQPQQRPEPPKQGYQNYQSDFADNQLAANLQQFVSKDQNQNVQKTALQNLGSAFDGQVYGQGQQNNTNLRLAQKQLQLMQEEANKYQRSFNVNQQAPSNLSLANSVQQFAQDQVKPDDPTLTDDSKGFRKRELKKLAKLDDKASTQLQKATVDQTKRALEAENQQMINQNIIYAPQIIFMQKGLQNMDPAEAQKMYMNDNPERRSKYYYYDPQRIEKSNLPIFKTERMLMNRPGYQQMLQEKFLRAKEQDKLTPNEGYDGLPEQDQDFQNFMLPSQYEAIGDPQLNFQLDTDKPELLNFMPGRTLDN